MFWKKKETHVHVDQKNSESHHAIDNKLETLGKAMGPDSISRWHIIGIYPFVEMRRSKIVLSPQWEFLYQQEDIFILIQSPVASFTKEVNRRLAKHTLKTNWRLANRRLNSLVKEATAVWNCACTVKSLI